MTSLAVYFVLGAVAALAWIVWSAFKRPFRAISDSAVDKSLEAMITFSIAFGLFAIWGIGVILLPFYGLFRLLVWLSGSDDTRKRKDESY